ncbi:MAG: delta 1-pyrroline-5-carboxylate reductase, partial [Betaproteobacteria bacterium]
YAFVQRLNQIHAEKLTYADDIRRSSDTEAERRTRVDAANWQLLERFRFEPDTAGSRIAQAGPQWLMLCVWCAVLMTATFWLGGRLKP